jgi:hypothetical protein
MRIAFDVDYTLIDDQFRPIPMTVGLVRAFLDNDQDIIIWSGGGADYARHQAEKIFDVNEMARITVTAKTSQMAKVFQPDICFDDEMVQLAKHNIQVPFGSKRIG